MRRKLVLIVLNSTAGGGHLLPLCNYAGQNHPAFVNCIWLRLFHVVEFLIVVVLILCFLLCACKQRCCLFGELLLESRIAVFAEDEFLVVAGCGLAVKGEGILALCCEVGVIPVQGPIAGLNSPLRFVLRPCSCLP